MVSIYQHDINRPGSLSTPYKLYPSAILKEIAGHLIPLLRQHDLDRGPHHDETIAHRSRLTINASGVKFTSYLLIIPYLIELRT